MIIPITQTYHHESFGMLHLVNNVNSLTDLIIRFFVFFLSEIIFKRLHYNSWVALRYNLYNFKSKINFHLLRQQVGWMHTQVTIFVVVFAQLWKSSMEWVQESHVMCKYVYKTEAYWLGSTYFELLDPLARRPRRYMWVEWGILPQFRKKIQFCVYYRRNTLLSRCSRSLDRSKLGYFYVTDRPNVVHCNCLRLVEIVDTTFAKLTWLQRRNLVFFWLNQCNSHVLFLPVNIDICRTSNQSR